MGLGYVLQYAPYHPKVVYQAPKRGIRQSERKGKRPSVKSSSSQHTGCKGFTRKSPPDGPTKHAWKTLLGYLNQKHFDCWRTWTTLSTEELAEIALLAGWKPGLTVYWQFNGRDYKEGLPLVSIAHWRCEIVDHAGMKWIKAGIAVEWFQEEILTDISAKFSVTF